MTGQRLRGLGGRVRVEVTGAAPEDFLTRLAAEGVPFQGLHWADELTLRMEVLPRHMGRVRFCAKKTMCGVEVLAVSGLLPFLRAMGWRTAYPAALLGLVLLVFWLQGHIWFFTVTGNETVPQEVILRALEEQGVGFFTPADRLDMNQVKNRALSRLPELGWLTINIQGGTAEVVVRERQETPVISRDAAPAHIAARKSGLITAIDAAQGSAQVRPGDVVEKGDILISGVTALEWTTLITRAEGEVYARTWNAVEAVLPGDRSRKVYTGREQSRWSLTLGKKTINFYKTSGISYREYDTIIDNTVLALPGGYAFPVTLTRRLFREYAAAAEPLDRAAAAEALEAAAVRQLSASLTAGRVLSKDLSTRQVQGGYRLTGTVECQEEIGCISEIIE